eukprot:2766179-Prymnesium_polylepis.1
MSQQADELASPDGSVVHWSFSQPSPRPTTVPLDPSGVRLSPRKNRPPEGSRRLPEHVQSTDSPVEIRVEPFLPSAEHLEQLMDERDHSRGRATTRPRSGRTSLWGHASITDSRTARHCGSATTSSIAADLLGFSACAFAAHWDSRAPTPIERSGSLFGQVRRRSA